MGKGGWCCRKAEMLNFVGNGCDGTFGGNDHHTCVLHPGIY